MSSADTIFALSSGRLPSGIAVIRMTGPQTRMALGTIFGFVPEPRVARFGAFRAGTDIFDNGICLYFPGPGSVTGEDCGELHLHGGVAVVKTALTILEDLDGLRIAEPGEFTRRAFLNGKIDLNGAEALADLIAAETAHQLEMASAAGAKQSGLYLSWRHEILGVRALLESALDFSDQDDVPDLALDEIREGIVTLSRGILAHVSRFKQAEIVRTGFSVVLVGAPNAGKSSLLNALALRDVALVSDEPGTTRDSVSVGLDIDGYKVVMTDTAGLRDDPGRIEAMGIDRTRALSREADLVLDVRDLSHPIKVDLESSGAVISVGTKRDLVGVGCDVDVSVSSLTGDGIDDLLAMIGRRVASAVASGGEVWPTRERHVRHLRAAADALERACGAGMSPEFVAEELRQAAVELGRIVGVTDTEELLGEIFGRFCVGK